MAPLFNIKQFLSVNLPLGTSGFSFAYGNGRLVLMIAESSSLIRFLVSTDLGKTWAQSIVEGLTYWGNWQQLGFDGENFYISDFHRASNNSMNYLVSADGLNWEIKVIANSLGYVWVLPGRAPINAYGTSEPTYDMTSFRAYKNFWLAHGITNGLKELYLSFDKGQQWIKVNQPADAGGLIFGPSVDSDACYSDECALLWNISHIGPGNPMGYPFPDLLRVDFVNKTANWVWLNKPGCFHYDWERKLFITLPYGNSRSNKSFKSSDGMNWQEEESTHILSDSALGLVDARTKGSGVLQRTSIYDPPHHNPALLYVESENEIYPVDGCKKILNGDGKYELIRAANSPLIAPFMQGSPSYLNRAPYKSIIALDEQYIYIAYASNAAYFFMIEMAQAESFWTNKIGVHEQ